MNELKKSSRSWITWVILLAGLAVAFGIFLFIKKKKQSIPEEMEDDGTPEGVDIDDDDIIIENYKTISEGLSQEGLADEQLHRLVTAQAMHETAIFESDVLMKNKNYFGMNMPSKRPTTATGKVGGYANYDTRLDSARDYAMYYKYVGYPDTFKDVKSFVSALKEKAYFEDNLTNYMAGVNSHYKKLSSLLNVG
jgi:hypothetical protein